MIAVGWVLVGCLVCYVFGRMTRANADFDERLGELEAEAEERAQKP